VEPAGAVGFLLLIACANVANLMLLRTDGRAAGARHTGRVGRGMGRIARELVVESLALGVAGGALGPVLCFATLRLLPGGDATPRWEEISLDFRTLAFAVATSIGSALLFGLIPVWKCTRPHIVRSVSETRERRRASASRRGAGRLDHGTADRFGPDDPHVLVAASGRSWFLQPE
jgi:hypothetical protein